LVGSVHLEALVIPFTKERTAEDVVNVTVRQQQVLNFEIAVFDVVNDLLLLAGSCTTRVDEHRLAAIVAHVAVRHEGVERERLDRHGAWAVDGF
jgi:hypothetical protein